MKYLKLQQGSIAAASSCISLQLRLQIQTNRPFPWKGSVQNWRIKELRSDSRVFSRLPIVIRPSFRAPRKRVELTEKRRTPLTLKEMEAELPGFLAVMKAWVTWAGLNPHASYDVTATRLRRHAPRDLPFWASCEKWGERAHGRDIKLTVWLERDERDHSFLYRYTVFATVRELATLIVVQ